MLISLKDRWEAKLETEEVELIVFGLKRGQVGPVDRDVLIIDVLVKEIEDMILPFNEDQDGENSRGIAGNAAG